MEIGSATISCHGEVCTDLLGNAVEYNVSLRNATGFENAVTKGSWLLLLLLLIVAAGVLGNLLVVIAISVERRLQNITNYFLMSLSIADLLVSLVVMPGSLVHELMGYWPFGLVLCDVWQVCDVMLCTSSIMHMCVISVDRYQGIRAPLKQRNKSLKVTMVKIAAVWIISLTIALPIVVLSVLNPDYVLTAGTCAVFNQYFLIYGSLTAFFIPLLLMLLSYSLTIQLLNKQVKLCEAKTKEGGVMMRRSTSKKKRVKNAETPDRSEQPTQHTKLLAKSRHSEPTLSTPTSHTSAALKRASEHAVQTNGSILKSSYGNGGGHTNMAAHDVSTPEPPPPTQSKWDKMAAAGRNCSSPQHRWPVPPPAAVATTGDDVTAGGEPAPRLQVLLKKHKAAISVASLLINKNENIQAQKEMRSVRTERKAIKVLGTVFAMFVLCWCPFFSLNFTMGVCATCQIDPVVFKVFLWLGYSSSTLNPIIYTIFNKLFKRTFINILRCKIQLIKQVKQ